MDLATAEAVIEVVAKLVKTAVDLSPTVIKTYEDAKPFATAIYNLLRGTNITTDQLDELESRIAVMSAELQSPLPPATEDDL